MNRPDNNFGYKPGEETGIPFFENRPLLEAEWIAQYNDRRNHFGTPKEAARSASLHVCAACVQEVFWKLGSAASSLSRELLATRVAAEKLKLALTQG